MTVEELAREVMGSIDAEEGYLIAQRWITNRFHELSSLFSLKTQQKFGEAVIPGVYNTGTVTLVKGSDVVVGVGTNWTSALVGRYFRRERTLYEIEAVNSITQLTLLSPFVENSASGISYSIISRRVPLVSGIRSLQEIKVMRDGGTLEIIGTAEMDMRYPDRISIAANPEVVAEVGIDATVSPPLRLFEFYPYPQSDCLVSFTYFNYPEIFNLNSVIPDFIPPGVLKEGVLIDAFRFQMGKALKEGKDSIAGIWRNEMRAQETTWKRRMIEIATNSGSVDPGTIIFRKGKGSPKEC